MELKLIIPVLLKHHSSCCLPLGMNGRLALGWIGSMDNAFFPDVCMYNVSLNHQLSVIWKFLIYSSERIVRLTSLGQLDRWMERWSSVFKQKVWNYLFPLIISVYVRGTYLLDLILSPKRTLSFEYILSQINSVVTPPERLPSSIFIESLFIWMYILNSEYLKLVMLFSISLGSISFSISSFSFVWFQFWVFQISSISRWSSNL